MARNGFDGDFFGQDTAPYVSTGAAGTLAAGAETSAGADLGRVTVTPLFGSSQVSQPTATVTAGDTCAMSSDAPVPAGGDPMTGLSLADVTQTGAGRGSPRDLSPNAQNVPGMGAQIAAARRS
jgi:hypothetical protein